MVGIQLVVRLIRYPHGLAIRPDAPRPIVSKIAQYPVILGRIAIETPRQAVG